MRRQQRVHTTNNVPQLSFAEFDITLNAAWTQIQPGKATLDL